MESLLSFVERWPKHKNGQPIFKNCDDALLFAQLIYQDDDWQKLLKFYVGDFYIKLSLERDSEKPDLDRMMVLACNAQAFNACLDECLRISCERPTQ